MIEYRLLLKYVIYLEINFKDPKIHFKVDIGLPTPQRDKKMETAKRIEFIKKIKCNAELEKLSRNNECMYIIL